MSDNAVEQKALSYGWSHHPDGPWQARWRRYDPINQYEHQVSSAETACYLSELALKAVEGASPIPAQAATDAEKLLSQVEERFPNWRSYRDLIDCIDATLGGQNG